MRRDEQKSGFTIIEVVLVLAIAGLIFAMVFIALPALRASQREKQQKNDMTRTMTAITQFQSHNKGRSPFEGAISQATLERFVKRYIDDSCKTNGANVINPSATRREVWTMFESCSEKFTAPNGEPYSLHYLCRLRDNGCLANRDPVSGFIRATKKEVSKFYIFIDAKCDDEEGYVLYKKGDRSFAMFATSESGAIICLDNS